MRFLDRADAGRQLADKLRLLDLTDPLVLALPRGGVPVAHEVALALNAPMEVFVARKIGAPGRKELGIGAVAEGDGRVVDDFAVGVLGLSPQDFEALVAEEQKELERRVRHYRGVRPLPGVAGREVVLVDDGLATGVTAAASLHSLRAMSPARLVLAVPTCAPETTSRLRDLADDVVCVIAPADFYAVGLWYEDFSPTTDEEVLSLLLEAQSAPTHS